MVTKRVSARRRISASRSQKRHELSKAGVLAHAPWQREQNALQHQRDRIVDDLDIETTRIEAGEG
jgi:hypothetical protein